MPGQLNRSGELLAIIEGGTDSRGLLLGDDEHQPGVGLYSYGPCPGWGWYGMHPASASTTSVTAKVANNRDRARAPRPVTVLRMWRFLAPAPSAAGMFPFCSRHATLAGMPAQPSFLLDLRFTDLVDWWLRVECCGRTIDMPFRLLAGQKPCATLGRLLTALRCRQCGVRPGRVTLLDDPADRVAARLGAPGGWRIEIVLPDWAP
jgi:hypothetical protein